MILQNLVFPKEAICKEENLYIHTQTGELRSEKDRYVLSPGCEVDFFTYFNSFSAGKWNLYSRVQQAAMVLNCEGACEISLWESVSGCPDRCLAEEQLTRVGAGQSRLSFSVCESKGIVYGKVKAVTETILKGGWFETASDVTEKPVKIAVGICTFRREEFVKKTIHTLQNLTDGRNALLRDKLHVYVSDNGKTLPADELSNDTIQILPNRNIGGAGGFGRCLLEAVKNQKKYGFTHVLLMDDDIVLEPESLYRTYTLLAMRKEEREGDMLGGALLRLDIPYIQHANGEMWKGGRIGFTKRGFDLRNSSFLMKNEEDLPMEYNGWWYCCVPLGENFRGFPLPVFIHGDDIEYGLRFGGEIMTLNGIGVWHDAFDNRKASSMEYYDMRNTLIACAIHYPQFSCLSMIKRVCRHLAGQMLHLRVEDQKLTMKGVEDFCQGVCFLKKTDPTELHPKIMAMGYAMQDVSADLENMGIDVEAAKPHPEHLYEDAGFAKKHLLTINGYILPGRKESIALPMGCHPAALYRRRNVLLYDPDTKKGFYVTRRIRDLFITVGRCVKMGWLLVRKYKKTVCDFQKNGGELVTLKFWEDYAGTVRRKK